MVKIGLVCWKKNGLINDYIKPTKQKPWLQKVPTIKKGQFKGFIRFEKALEASLKYYYDDVEVSYMTSFDESKLKKNDVNFLVSVNLLLAWEHGKKEYNRVLQLMEDPSLNFYPNLKEQFFLFDKGDYLLYYEKHGIPIAPTFVVKDDRDPKKIVDKVKKEGWSSFVLKPHRAYANIGIGKFDKDSPNVTKEVSTFLTKHKQFPGFVCQEVMNGFAKFWEIKSYWINGQFKYYVAMKAADKVFSESKIYGSNPEEFGTVSPKVLKDIKRMGKKVLDLYPKMNPKSNPPLYLRIDFGCCNNNTMDGTSYFLNEIEFAGCSVFTEEGLHKDVLDLWVKGYYKKSKEFSKRKMDTSKKKAKKKTRKCKKTRQRKDKRKKKTRRK